MLDGLAYLINQETYVPVHVADNPITCVARGCGKLLEMLDGMQSVLVSSRAYA